MIILSSTHIRLPSFEAAAGLLRMKADWNYSIAL
jgi:hypothetical protein